MAEIVLGPRQYYFLFFIKRFNYPISARDTGNDLVRQRANSIRTIARQLFPEKQILRYGIHAFDFLSKSVQ